MRSDTLAALAAGVAAVVAPLPLARSAAISRAAAAGPAGRPWAGDRPFTQRHPNDQKAPIADAAKPNIGEYREEPSPLSDRPCRTPR
jgi:hypothetical protein